MGVDHLQDEPKLILTYPHKSTFNRIGFSSMVSLSFIVLWILNHLMSYNTDFSDKIIMAIVLVGAPLLIWFMGYYLFINGVKLEIYENNIVKYYTLMSVNLIADRKESEFFMQQMEQFQIKQRRMIER